MSSFALYKKRIFTARAAHLSRQIYEDYAEIITPATCTTHIIWLINQTIGFFFIISLFICKQIS